LWAHDPQNSPENPIDSPVVNNKPYTTTVATERFNKKEVYIVNVLKRVKHSMRITVQQRML
jgi:hypothetical protein